MSAAIAAAIAFVVGIGVAIAAAFGFSRLQRKDDHGQGGGPKRRSESISARRRANRVRGDAMAVAQERVDAETSRARAEIADESAGSDFGELLRDWNNNNTTGDGGS